MIGRQKRLMEVYEQLRKNGDIHTKTDFADVLHYGRTTISAAINGKESYLTDKLFKNICDVFPGVFDLNYLLTGEGHLLHAPATSHPTPISDTHSIIADLQDELILVRQLRHELLALTSELRHIIHNHPSQPYPSIAAEDTPPPTNPPQTPDT